MTIREQVKVATTRATVEGVIPDKMYFRIGEVAAIVGVKPYVLRYWESEFAALRPQKSRTRQRMYRRRDVELLLKIKHLLYDRKYTIAGARQLLKRGLGAGFEAVLEPQAEGASPASSSVLADGPVPIDSRDAEPSIQGWVPPAAAPQRELESPAPAAVQVTPSNLVAQASPSEAQVDDPRTQLTFDLRVPVLVKDDLRRGLRELLELCDTDEAEDPDPLVRMRRAHEDDPGHRESASDIG
ncbi:MAG: MerR family transcriptional regulator [Pseudomonadota bacterium]